MKYYVVAPDYGYEGLGPAEAVFDSYGKAEAYVLAQNTKWHGYDITEVEMP